MTPRPCQTCGLPLTTTRKFHTNPQCNPRGVLACEKCGEHRLREYRFHKCAKTA